MIITPAQSPDDYIIGLVNKANKATLVAGRDLVSTPTYYPSTPEYGVCTVYVDGIDSSGISGELLVRFNRPNLTEAYAEHLTYDKFAIMASGKVVQAALNEVSSHLGIWGGDLYTKVETLPYPNNGTHVSKLRVYIKDRSVFHTGYVDVFLNWEATEGPVDIAAWIYQPDIMDGWA